MTQPESLDMEAPEADAAEQATLADPGEDEDESPTARSRSVDSLSMEAPEWDVLEQSRQVRLDDDDDR